MGNTGPEIGQKQIPHDIERTTTEFGVHSTGFPGKLSSFVLNFLKQESQLLKQYIQEPEDPGVSTNVSSLDPAIKKKLDQIADTQARFNHLLSYNPLLVPPSIYRKYYESIDSVDPSTKILYIRRLAFHSWFDECWKVVLETNLTSLSDIEEFLDIVTEELDKNQNVKLGFYQFLLASEDHIPNQSIQHAVLESMAYRFKMSLAEISEFSDFYHRLEGTEASEMANFMDSEHKILQTNVVYRIFAYRKLREIDSPLVGTIKEDTEVYSVLGFLSFFLSVPIPCMYLSPSPSNVTARAAPKGVAKGMGDHSQKTDENRDRMGENTQKTIESIEKRGEYTELARNIEKFDRNSQELARSIDIFTRNDQKQANSIQKTANTPTKSNINRSIDRTPNKEPTSANSGRILGLVFGGRKFAANDADMLAVCQLPVASYPLYIFFHRNYRGTRNAGFVTNYVASMVVDDVDTVAMLAIKHCKLLNTETLEHILPLLFHQAPAQFGKVMKRLRHNSPVKNSIVVGRLIDSLAPLDPELAYRLVATLGRCGFGSHIDAVVRDQVWTQDFYERVLAERVPRPVVLEIGRAAILQLGAPLALVDQVFERILQSCWNVARITARLDSDGASGGGPLVDPFHELYRKTTAAEKAAFHNGLRAFAQTLSLVDPPRACLVLNSLHRLVHSAQFAFLPAPSPVGRRYLMDNLVGEVMRFAQHSGIMAMRDILHGLEFTSSVAEEAVYKKLIQDTPALSLEILELYRDKKAQLGRGLVLGVMAGILTTPQLGPTQRLQLFESFRKQHAKLGYRGTLKVGTVTQLVNLLISVTENDPARSLDSLSWVLPYARDKNVPKHIIAVWEKKIL